MLLLFGYTKHYCSTLITALVVISLLLGLLVLVTPSRLALAIVLLGFIGLGAGVTMVLQVVALSYAIPSHLLGTCITFASAIRALGGAVGITIFSSIYSNKMADELARIIEVTVEREAYRRNPSRASSLHS